jgi:hypothetical protein
MLILDTDIASAFAKAGHFDVLMKLFGRMGITPGVYEYSFSSFDKKAISAVTELGVKYVTAGAIFKGLVVKGIATKEEVLRIIRDIEVSDNRVLDVEL